MNLKKLVLLNFIRVFILILVFKITIFVIPYWGFFPFKEYITRHNLPSYISIFAHFDGVHYLRIAQDGYYEFSQAFFPVYPLLIRFFRFLFSGNYLTSALAISNICFITGMYFAYKYAQTVVKDKAWLFVLLYLVFPTSFFFNGVYTEGLFFLLFFMHLYALQKKYFVLAGVIASVASATRLIGVLFIIPLFFAIFREKKKRIYKGVILVLPFVGFLVYCVYLYVTTGNPFFFFTSQTAFGANRSTSLILLPQVYYRYLKIFLTAKYDFAYLLAAFEVIVCTVFLIISTIYSVASYKKKDWQEFAIGLFSIINIVLPTLTGTFSSIARYALFSPAVFLFFASLKSKVVQRDIIIISFFLQCLLFSFFAQGYFVG